MLTLIPYNQLSGKISTTESIRVEDCVCKEEERDVEKYRFIVEGEEESQSYTFQAMSDFERKHWVEALGGSVNTLQRIKADSIEDNINSLAFAFLKDCLSELERRGMEEKGLYRVVGVVSKVKKLLLVGLDNGGGDLDLSDPKQWESKTIASAIKQFLRDLSKPLMTHHLYEDFLSAAKLADDEDRLKAVEGVLRRLPSANKQMLKVLIVHLRKVSLKADANKMTAGNLSVCFGPTLLRPREETVASIMDIKFCNEVVQILIENCDRLFPEKDEISTPSTSSSTTSSPQVALRSRDQIDSCSVKPTKSTSVPPPLPSRTKKQPAEKKSLPTLTFSSPPPGEGSSSLPRPRSKSHQHEFKLTFARDEREQSSPPVLLSKVTTDEDLMASLEMMHSLAADLPTSVKPASSSRSPSVCSSTLSDSSKTVPTRASELLLSIQEAHSRGEVSKFTPASSSSSLGSQPPIPPARKFVTAQFRVSPSLSASSSSTSSSSLRTRDGDGDDEAEDEEDGQVEDAAEGVVRGKAASSSSSFPPPDLVNHILASPSTTKAISDREKKRHRESGPYENVFAGKV